MNPELDSILKPKTEQDAKPGVGANVLPKQEQAVKPKLEPGVEPRVTFNPELKPTPKALPKLEQDDDRDGLAALDALESEAKEFNKVPQSLLLKLPLFLLS